MFSWGQKSGLWPINYGVTLVFALPLEVDHFEHGEIARAFEVLPNEVGTRDRPNAPVFVIGLCQR